MAERDALAKALKQAGQAEQAADIKGLRKPSVSAWAVNQAVRAAPDQLDELLAAAADLRAAQGRALRGEGSPALKEAMKRHRTAIAALVKVATPLAGGSAAQLERITGTLQATATSEAAAEAVRAGRLTADLDPSGFGDLGEDDGAVAAPAARGGGDGQAKREKRVPGARARDDGRPARSDRGAPAGKTPGRDGDGKQGRPGRAGAAARAEELEQEAARAETEAGLAEAEHERLEQLAGEVEAAAKAARQEASEARRAAVEARRAADGARRRADRARERAGRT